MRGEKEVKIIDLLDLISTLIIKHLILKDKKPFEFYQTQLRDTFCYNLEREEYRSFSLMIQKEVPDFDDPFLDIDVYSKSYLKLLGKFDINLLIFLDNLKRTNLQSFTLTPLLRDSHCNSSNMLKKSVGYKTGALKNVSLVSDFKQMVSVIKCPETQLHSPILKK